MQRIFSRKNYHQLFHTRKAKYFVSFEVRVFKNIIKHTRKLLYGYKMRTANNSYGTNTPKQINITAHLPETQTYLKRFAYVYSEYEAWSA